MSTKLLASLILVFAIIHTVSCIKCHNCTSHVTPQCADVSSKDTATLVDCTMPGAFCRKVRQVMIDTGETRIMRACGWLKFENHDGDYCMNSNTNFKKETSCQCFTDGCNGGDAVKAVSAMVLVVLAFVVL